MNSLKNYCKKVNDLSKKKCAKINRDARSGKSLFGAIHFDYPEIMLAPYWAAGYTPAEALRKIGEEAAAEGAAEARVS